MDSNAHHRLWNSNFDDFKGKMLEETFIQYHMNVVNVPLNKLKYKPVNTTFIDITLVGDEM